MNEKETIHDYKTIREDFRWDPSIFSGEPRRVAIVKYILDNVLTDVDRILILLYVDEPSYRKLGKRLGISHTTAAQQIHRIKDQIRKEYDKLKDHPELI